MIPIETGQVPEPLPVKMESETLRRDPINREQFQERPKYIDIAAFLLYYCK